MDIVSELRPGVRQIQEYGFKEIGRSDRISLVTHIDMPWLVPEPKGFRGHIVPLVRATNQSGESFYLGSLVSKGTLTDEAKKLTRDESDRANKLLYCELQRFTQGSRAVDALTHAKTMSPYVPPEKRRQIYKVSNGRGAVRVFFMRVDDVDGLPVFIKVGVSAGKNSEIRVLSELTTEDIRVIKKKCLGK